MTTRTPGPWIAEKVGRQFHITLDRPDRPPIAWIGGTDSAYAAANAHLIAAAPELYETCLWLADMPDPRTEEGMAQFSLLRSKARKATAKAKGN